LDLLANYFVVLFLKWNDIPLNWLKLPN